MPAFVAKKPRAARAPVDLIETREHDLRGAETARFAGNKTFRQIHVRSRALLDDNERALVEPASIAQNFERWRDETLSIGRIDEGKVKLLLLRRRS